MTDSNSEETAKEYGISSVELLSSLLVLFASGCFVWSILVAYGKWDSFNAMLMGIGCVLVGLGILMWGAMSREFPKVR
jgi:uncharacterized membrane protein